MNERPRPPSLSVPCIRLSPDLDRQIRGVMVGAERYSDTVRRILRLGLRVAAPTVVWEDDDDASVARIGAGSVYLLIVAERWQTDPTLWGASVALGKDSARGWDAVPISASGRKAPGHPSREAAKQAAEAGLRQWLASLAGGGQ